MFGKLFCLFGLHKWDRKQSGSLTVKTERLDGHIETKEYLVYSKSCKRCLKRSPKWETSDAYFIR